jgi:hypothetical protein
VGTSADGSRCDGPKNRKWNQYEFEFRPTKISIHILLIIEFCPAIYPAARRLSLRTKSTQRVPQLWSQKATRRRMKSSMKEDVHKTTNPTLDTFQRVTKATQAIANEIADYSKRSFDSGAQTLEELFGVKSLDKAIELQNEAAKAAFDRYVAHTGKLGELYTNLAKEAFQPYEGLVAK